MISRARIVEILAIGANIAAVAGLLGAGLSWRAKLIQRYDALAEQVDDIEADVARQSIALDAGVLPRTDERLRAQEKRIATLEERVKKDEEQFDELQRYARRRLLPR